MTIIIINRLSRGVLICSDSILCGVGRNNVYQHFVFSRITGTLDNHGERCVEDIVKNQLDVIACQMSVSQLN